MNDVSDELGSLHGMTTNELCDQCRQLFGQPRSVLATGPTCSANLAGACRRCPRATCRSGRRRASELADDPRLPAPGAAIVRWYKGREPPRTTKLYDRTSGEVNLGGIEQILP